MEIIQDYFTDVQFEQMAERTHFECYIDECDMYFQISKN